MMNQVLRIALGVVALACIDVTSSVASARDYPFCIKGYDYDSVLGDCSFDTYEQCKATASGRHDYCDANPYYVSQARGDAALRRKRARR